MQTKLASVCQLNSSIMHNNHSGCSLHYTRMQINTGFAVVKEGGKQAGWSAPGKSRTGSKLARNQFNCCAKYALEHSGINREMHFQTPVTCKKVTPNQTKQYNAPPCLPMAPSPHLPQKVRLSTQGPVTQTSQKKTLRNSHSFK